MKKIGIVGTRRRNHKRDFRKVNDAFLLNYQEGDSIVSGGCEEGGDWFAELLSAIYRVEIRIHPPDKSKLNQELLEKNPRAAYAEINYARNTLIAQDSDILIACVAPDRKGGTEDTIKKFKKFHPEGKLILC